jgi:hypothetical protein
VEPTNGSKVYGVIDIIGSAYDAEDELEKVEIKIGDTSDWVPVNGLAYWTYELNINEYVSKHKTAEMVLVKARAEDATGNKSFLDKAYLYIRKSRDDTDGDGVPDYKDTFPNDPSEWQDSDYDGIGDNSDHFPMDVTQWEDTDGDGYGDNPDGNSPDRFPYDPTQWEDIDGDGHGDNPWGNAGDHYRNDPENWMRKEQDEAAGKSSQEDQLYLLMLIGLGVVIILTIMVFFNYISNLRKNNKS